MSRPYTPTLPWVGTDVPMEVLREAGEKTWVVAQDHPSTASCSCVAVAAIEVLYANGYKVVRDA